MRAYAISCLPVFLLGAAACANIESQQIAEQRLSGSQALDSVAAWSFEMTGDFYHQLRGWITLPSGRDLIASGTREITIFSETGEQTVIARAGDQEVLTLSDDGSHFGVMRLQNEVVQDFDVRTLAGENVWRQAERGHHYYQIGADARAIAGLSSNIALSGRPRSIGTVVLYDREGAETGRFDCPDPGSSRFSPDGSVYLVECRGSGLFVIDLAGRPIHSMEGHYRSFAVSGGGTMLVAVPVGDPTVLAVEGVGRESSQISFPAPIRQVALTAEGDLVVVAVGGALSGIDTQTGAVRWERDLEGPSPLATSLRLGADGLIAVGVLLESNEATTRQQGPFPAAVELLRDGRRIQRFELGMRGLNAWVPSVALDPTERWLVVSDPSLAWAIDLANLISR